jgi:hypothetical protein
MSRRQPQPGPETELGGARATKGGLACGGDPLELTGRSAAQETKRCMQGFPHHRAELLERAQYLRAPTQQGFPRMLGQVERDEQPEALALNAAGRHVSDPG